MKLQKSSVTVLALDPGFDRLGWAVGQKNTQRLEKVTNYGTFETNRTKTIAERYLSLSENLNQVIHEYTPTELAIETLFFAKNTTTALKVAEARGIMLLLAAEAEMKIFEYAPTQIKMAVTGDGRASKSALMRMIQLQLKIPKTQLLDDTYDALGILLTHCEQNSALSE